MQHGGAGPGLSRRFLAVAVVSLVAFLVLALLAADRQFSSLDHEARALVQLTRLPSLDPAMTGVSGLGESYGLIPLMALGVALLWRSSRRWAVALPLLMAGTGVLQLVAKWAIDRPRPNLAEWGFPSGHVLSLVVFFGLVAYLLATSTLTRSRQRLGYTGCAATVVVVAFSRLYLEAHWVSDLAGGFTLGVGYLLLTIGLVETVARRYTTRV
ncbi:MAG: phosphatase PAP2 family protein, partial [Candidatus Rokuibacteriota bacterium]